MGKNPLCTDLQRIKFFQKFARLSVFNIVTLGKLVFPTFQCPADSPTIVKFSHHVATFKTSVTGAAPITVDTLEYFAMLGIQINEVYGMSGTFNVGDEMRIGIDRAGYLQLFVRLYTYPLVTQLNY